MKPSSQDVRKESVRAALLALYEVHDGALTPEHIVNAARDDGHPLHDQFEWDDEIAGEHYRLAQAGALVRRMKLTILRSDRQARSIAITTTRQFQSRPSHRGAEGGYETLEDILSDEDKRKELLEQVLKELNSYRKRYAALTELAGVWDAIMGAQPKTKRARSGTRPEAPTA